MKNLPQSYKTLAHFTFGVFAIFLCVFLLVRFETTPVRSSTSIELNIIGGKTLRLENSIGKTKRKIHIPKFMLELYEQNKKIQWSESVVVFPDIVRSVIPLRANSISQIPSRDHILEFNLPANKENEKFVGAELKILTLVESPIFSGIKTRLRVYFYDHFKEKYKIVHKIYVNQINNTWISFNLTDSVSTLLSLKKLKLRLILSIADLKSEISLKLSLLPQIDNLEHDYPVLLLSYISLRNNTKNRMRRSVEEDYEEETNKIWENEMLNKAQAKKIKRMKNTCRKKPLYVDFTEIQYDSWIVQPSGYEAYQCTGKCFYPVAEHLSPTKHAIVQSLLHSVSPSRAVRSCCVPTKLNSISLLYIDEKGVLTYRYGYDDMVVEECGCR